MSESPIKSILRLLDREHEALRAGDLSVLSTISEEKAALEETLRRSRVEPEDLEILRAKAASNADMLAAAIRGVKAARERVAALSDVQNVLSVYGPKGDMQRVSTAKSGLQKKA